MQLQNYKILILNKIEDIMKQKKNCISNFNMLFLKKWGNFIDNYNNSLRHVFVTHYQKNSKLIFPITRTKMSVHYSMNNEPKITKNYLIMEF